MIFNETIIWNQSNQVYLHCIFCLILIYLYIYSYRERIWFQPATLVLFAVMSTWSWIIVMLIFWHNSYHLLMERSYHTSKWTCVMLICNCYNMLFYKKKYISFFFFKKDIRALYIAISLALSISHNKNVHVWIGKKKNSLYFSPFPFWFIDSSISEKQTCAREDTRSCS